MKKIFYLLPILLIGLAFFACSNEDDGDDGGVANAFTNPEILKKGSKDIIKGVVATNKDFYKNLSPGALQNPRYFQDGGKGTPGSSTFATPEAMPELGIVYGKVVTQANEADDIKKGDGTFYLLQFTAAEFLGPITELEVELDAGKIDDDDETKAAILAAVQKLTFYDKLEGSDKSEFDEYFLATNLKVTKATSSSPAEVEITSESKTITLKPKAVSPPQVQPPTPQVGVTAQPDGSTVAKAIELTGNQVVAGKITNADVSGDIDSADVKYYALNAAGTGATAGTGTSPSTATALTSGQVVAGKITNAPLSGDIVSADVKYYKAP